MPGQNFRAKNIVFLQLRNAFEVLYPQTQIIELPTREVQQPQSEARGKNPGLHDLVVYQLELASIKQRG